MNARLKEAGEREEEKKKGGDARHRHLENLIKPRERKGTRKGTRGCDTRRRLQEASTMGGFAPSSTRLP